MVAGLSGASNERNMKNTTSYDTSTGELVAKNQGPSTPVKFYKGMGIERNPGAAGATNVRPKPGFTLKDVYGK